MTRELLTNFKREMSTKIMFLTRILVISLTFLVIRCFQNIYKNFLSEFLHTNFFLSEFLYTNTNIKFHFKLSFLFQCQIYFVLI
jgi:hypothetical protein